MAEWTSIFNLSDWDVYVAIGDGDYLPMDQLDPELCAVTIENGAIVVNDLTSGFGYRPSIVVVAKGDLSAASYRLTVTTGSGFRFGQDVFFGSGTYNGGSDFVDETPKNEVGYSSAGELGQVTPLPHISKPGASLIFGNFVNPY